MVHWGEQAAICSSRHMMTSSNGNIFHVTGPLCGEFTGEFPSQRPVTRSFDVSSICAWINGWVNNREAGDLRRHRAHYDVIVMYSVNWAPFWIHLSQSVSKYYTECAKDTLIYILFWCSLRTVHNGQLQIVCMIIFIDQYVFWSSRLLYRHWAIVLFITPMQVKCFLRLVVIRNTR